MDDIKRIQPQIIKMEISIKLVDYLKRKSVIDEKMANYCIDKLIHKSEQKRSKTDAPYDLDINGYKLLL